VRIVQAAVLLLTLAACVDRRSPVIPAEALEPCETAADCGGGIWTCDRPINAAKGTCVRIINAAPTIDAGAPD
jgi:hypothetical protein